MKPKFFTTQGGFRKWLKDNHERETEIIVGFYNVRSGKGGMNWSEAVDQALCFGWIDGVRRSIDEESYSIRFTPRKPKSIWSAVNLAKVRVLTEKGLMKPEGIAAFAKRDENKSRIYAYERKAAKLSVEFEKQFKANKKAWEFFQNQAPSYRKTIIYWVISAKQEATRQSRLEKLIVASADEKRI